MNVIILSIQPQTRIVVSYKKDFEVCIMIVWSPRDTNICVFSTKYTSGNEWAVVLFIESNLQQNPLKKSFLSFKPAVGQG